MRINIIGQSDVGLIRKNNEDSFGIFADGRLFCVADGMGGHSCGEVASRIAVDVVGEFSTQAKEIPSPEHAKALFMQAAREIHARMARHVKEKREGHDMGTTLVAAHLADNGSLTFANCGDSRIYLFRRGVLLPLTVDHSFVFDQYVIPGVMSREQVRTHRMSNKISRVFHAGSRYIDMPDVDDIYLEAGDRILMCSDGLTDMFPEKHLEEILRENKNKEDALSACIITALEAGGYDNITAVLCDVLEEVQ